MPPSPGRELPKPGRPVVAGGGKERVTVKDAVYQVITERVIALLQQGTAPEREEAVL